MKLTNSEDIKSFNLLVDLLQKASNPPLRYNLSQYEKQWEEFAQTKNIKGTQSIKDAFFGKLKLLARFSYLRNIFNKYNFEKDVFPIVSNKKNNIFDTFVQEHISKKQNPENCQLKDVAFYELEAELSGLDKIYNFLIQPAIACQLELEACTHFLDSQISQ